MGLLINGDWHTDWYDTDSTNGEFVRQDAQFTHTISDNDFPAQPNRYHLFVSLACPWAHRTLIFRRLKQLEPIIGVTVVQPIMRERGWEINSDHSQALGYDASPVTGITCLHQLYTTENPNYSGRVTVPVLWDTHTQRIVNNESSQIIRLLNHAFNAWTNVTDDYYPEALRSQIDKINAFVYEHINNGVYRAGFATTQAAYERAYHRLFEALDTLEQRLGIQRYLVGNTITEADWRLFTTLIRFDAVYYQHFKSNKQRIDDYPNLANYTRELYQYPGIASTVNMDHIKTHYYASHDTINPTGIVPVGPVLDFDQPHNRDQLF